MIQDVCPQIKGITDLGVSDFGPEVTAPIPIVNEKQLRTLTTSISSLQQQEFVNVALIGNAGQAYPPNSLRFAATLLRPTQDRQVGMLKWTKGRGLFIRIAAFEAVVPSLRLDCNLASMARAFQVTGWQIRDIDFSTTPCAPFFHDEPAVSEQTAIMSAISLDDILTAKECISEASRHMGRQAWCDAIQAFNRALEMNPADADAWAGKAGALMMTKTWEEVLRCCDNALIAKPEHPGAWFNKGLCLVNGMKN